MEVNIDWQPPLDAIVSRAIWVPGAGFSQRHEACKAGADPRHKAAADSFLARVRYHALDPRAPCTGVTLSPGLELMENGANLAGVLDQLRDRDPERFDGLKQELARWLPEFDKALFATPGQEQRSILLRAKDGHHAIQASELSQGTLLALAILTLGYLPEPPSLVCPVRL